MIKIRFLAALAATALLATSPAIAQTAASTAAPKVIGQPQQPRVVPSMIVLNAKGAKLGGGKLVLDGVSPNAIIFADRPVRSAGHALTSHLLEEWSGNDSFAKTPPNATVSVLMKAKAAVVDAVVVLKSPKLEGDKLTFDVDVLEGDLAGGDGAASVFMDIINLPLSARRTSHRGAWYHGAN
ncbi:MAG: hypothetical protein ISP49_21795 [Reyranella sp.]|nr:hypothetical protein [Reyranella sp.]MBL6654242.1 hypothetical protein [Reyranella sp.]